MKYLDYPRLALITSSLDDTLFGDRRVRGQTEAYSCKLAGEDKVLFKEFAETSDVKENIVRQLVRNESGRVDGRKGGEGWSGKCCLWWLRVVAVGLRR